MASTIITLFFSLIFNLAPISTQSSKEEVCQWLQEKGILTEPEHINIWNKQYISGRALFNITFEDLWDRAKLPLGIAREIISLVEENLQPAASSIPIFLLLLIISHSKARIIIICYFSY